MNDRIPTDGDPDIDVWRDEENFLLIVAIKV